MATREELEEYKTLKQVREELIKLAEEDLATQTKKAEALGEQISATDKLLAKQRIKAKADVDAAAYAKEQQELLKSYKKEMDALNLAAADAGEKKAELLKAEMDALEKKTFALEFHLGLEEKAIENAKEKAKASDIESSQMEKRAELARGIVGQAAKLMGVTDKLESTTEGQIVALMRQKGAMDSLKAAFKERFTFDNIGISLVSKVIEKTVELAKNTDKTTAAIAMATGEGDKYNNVLMDSYYELRTFNIDVGEAGESIIALQEKMAVFSKESKEVRKELILVTAQLDKLGISNAQTADTLNFLTKAMGQTSTQSAQTMRDLYGLSQALQVPPKVLMEDFKQASAQLSVYGKNMQKEFASIAGAAKETGISMGRLLTIAEQYDTFEGAATAVGRFNAMMGGPYLNAIEQLNATEEDRIRNMIRAMDASGKAFGSLDKYEQKAIAASVGITDMAEANQLFGRSLSAYDAAQAKAKLSTVSQEEFEEASLKALSVAEKFAALGKSLAIGMEPVIWAVGYLLDGLLMITDWAGKATGWVALIVGGLMLLAGAKMAAAAAAGKAGAAMKSMGTAATSAVKGMLGLFPKLGEAAKHAGTAIKNMAKSSATAVKSMGEGVGKGIGNTVKQAGKGVGEGMEEVAKGARKAKDAVPVILAYGAAALMLGRGLYYAATGFAEFAKSLENLSGEQLVAMVFGLGLLTAVFIVFISSLAALAPLGIVAAKVIAAIALAVFALGLGIGLAAAGLSLFVKMMEGSLKILTDWSAEQMMALGSLAFALALFGAAGAIGMLLFASAVGVLAYALFALDLEKLNSLSGLMKETAEFNKSVQKLTKEKADIAEGLFKAAADYNITVVKSRSSDDVTDAASKLIAAMSTSQAQKAQPLVANITIEAAKLGGRNLTREIRREVNTIAKPTSTA